MANYFRNLPKVRYDINGAEPNKFLNVTNIMKRVSFKPSVIEDITNYYPYRIKDGERPDILSFEKYCSVAFAYLIMLINNITDPLFDWPLSAQQFEKYLINKYGSVSSSMGTTKYYYQIIRAEVARTGTSERIPAVKFIVDQTTYDALGTGDRTTQSQYEWEDELNDNKRDIKLIDASLIQDIDYAVKRTYAS